MKSFFHKAITCMIKPYLKYFIRIKETLKNRIAFYKSKIFPYFLESNIRKSLKTITSKHKSKKMIIIITINKSKKLTIIIAKMKHSKAFLIKFGWMEIIFKDIGMIENEEKQKYDIFY